MLSGSLVFASIVPYAIRVYQKKIHPVPTSWSLWSLIGLALLLTYRSSGAQANLWPALFGFVNPTLIAILAIRQREQWKRLELWDWACFIFGVISLVAWWFVRQRQELSQYALYLAIVADLCASIPTLVFFKEHPMEDRPFAWLLFGIGYFLALFAITTLTFANVALPLYMAAAGIIAAFLLAIPRIRHKVPLKEWV